MSTFFKNQFSRLADKPNRKQIAELLDTDEDRVINQYRRYLNYINQVKKELIEKSASLVGYKNRKISLQ